MNGRRPRRNRTHRSPTAQMSIDRAVRIGWHARLPPQLDILGMKVVWGSQWGRGARRQHELDRYDCRFQEMGVNDDVRLLADTHQKYRTVVKAEACTAAITGNDYLYTEGGIPFPERIACPALSILTGKGGNTPSRFTTSSHSRLHSRTLTVTCCAQRGIGHPAVSARGPHGS